MDDLIEQKRIMRLRAASERDRVAHVTKGELRQTFLSVPLLRENSVVSGYHPIGSEIDPRPLLAMMHWAGHRVVLPVVAGKDRPLQFREWVEGDPMSKGPFGVREPLPEAREAMPDVLLVPLLAFDRRGFRLGYGGGFFDRTLSMLRKLGSPLAIGIGFSAQEVNTVPAAEYDQPLNWIVTEQEAIETGV